MKWNLFALYFVIATSFLLLLLTEGDTSEGKIRNYYTPADLHCMAEAIYFEARSESSAGKLAVGHVILNRTKSKRFPNSICGVIHQGEHHASGVPKLNRCQFSYYCDGKPDHPGNAKQWRESLRVAEYLIHGRDFILDITDGSQFYHAKYINQPYWAVRKSKQAEIDQHIFYR